MKYKIGDTVKIRQWKDMKKEFGLDSFKAKDLYQNFKMWAKSEGAYVLSARKFNSEMERHPEWFDRKSTSSGFVIYWGLKLKEVL